MRYEIVVMNEETGDTYYDQVFTKLDIRTLVKTLNDVWWSDSDIKDKEPEKE